MRFIQRPKKHAILSWNRALKDSFKKISKYSGNVFFSEYSFREVIWFSGILLSCLTIFFLKTLLCIHMFYLTFQTFIFFIISLNGGYRAWLQLYYSYHSFTYLLKIDLCFYFMLPNIKPQTLKIMWCTLLFFITFTFSMKKPTSI